MDNKTRWLKTMRFEPVDHPPLSPGGPWATTLKRWEHEGLPKGADLNEYFGLERLAMRHVAFDHWLYPPFEEKILEETDDYVVKINVRGIKERNFRDGASMPEFLDYPIKGPEDLGWLKVKLDFHAPGRIKPDWLAEARNRQSETLHYVNGGMYFGFLNEHMGTEALMYAYADHPDFIHQVSDLQCTLTEKALELVLPQFTLDIMAYHEDMAYRNGPLISPAMFREFMMPYYKRVTHITARHGIGIHFMDSDGDIRKLIPLWLECGINLFAPMEVAAGMDVVQIRKEYGKKVCMAGGFDKRILASGKAEIKRELERLRPVMEEGGYIPGCDHGVPHDVSLENFCCFVDSLKTMFGIKKGG